MPAALLGFAIAIAYWPNLISSAVAPRWALIAAGLPLVSWLDPRRVALLPATLLVGGFLYASLSVLWTVNPLGSINDLIHLALFGGAALVAANMDDATILLRGIAWGVAVSAVIAVLQTFGVSVVSQAAAPAGLLYNKDFLGELAAILFVWAALNRERGLFVLLAIALALTGSRVAVLSAAVALVMVASRRQALALLLAVLAAAFLAVYSVTEPTKLITALNRIDIWQAAISGATAAGNGLGSFTANFPFWEYAHSDFLQSVYELGVGSAFFAGLIVWCVFVAEGSVAWRAATLCMAVQYFVAFPLHLPVSAFLAGVLVGHMARRRIAAGVITDDGGGQLVPAV